MNFKEYEFWILYKVRNGMMKKQIITICSFRIEYSRFVLRRPFLFLPLWSLFGNGRFL